MAKKLGEASGRLGFTIEEAAQAFSEHLPEPIQQFLAEMELQEGTPRHVYLLSYVMRHYELGEMSYRMGEAGLPGDTGGRMFSPAAKAKEPELVECAWCHMPFTPERLGQRFCPDKMPETGELSCGFQASVEERRKAREAKGDFRDTRATAEHEARRKSLVVNNR